MAVIGGGVSGLTAATTWLRMHPSNTVTVFEGKSNVGGWSLTEYAREQGLADCPME